MWLLHVVVVQGGGIWPRGILFWLIAAAAGGSFAYLTGEIEHPDQQLADVIIAAAGGIALNAAVSTFGTDPIAQVFGVRFFWTAAGAFFLLCLTHDLVRLVPGNCRRGQEGTLPALVITERGGFLYLLVWISGWPSEAGIVEATYDGGLGIKLLLDSLHYQVRAGPFLTSRTLPLVSGLHVVEVGTALSITAEPGSAAEAMAPRPVLLADVCPAGASGRIAATAMSNLASMQ